MQQSDQPDILSPIKEGETISTPPDGGLKPQQLAALNSELSKINNSRRDSVVVVEPEEKPKVEVALAPPVVDSEKKERKISRFKVSVVTEPDLNKLVVPEEQPQRGGDVATAINDAYRSLEKVVASCYTIKPGWCCSGGVVFIFGLIVLLLQSWRRRRRRHQQKRFVFFFVFLLLILLCCCAWPVFCCCFFVSIISPFVFNHCFVVG